MTVKVLYIVGWKRSGSTVLGNLIGELPGFVHAGELRTLWGQGMLHGRLCGCGIPVGDCEFWSAVLASVASTTEVNAEKFYGWQRDAIRMRYLRTLLSTHAPSGRSAMDEYASVASSLYQAIAEVSGAGVVVDSSKQPADAALLARLDVDPYFVHLVRDPRAVAHSWRRKKSSPGEGPRQEMMVVKPGRSSASWLSVDLAAEFIRRRFAFDRSILVRYEDFVTDPRATLESITRLVGMESIEVPDPREASFRLSRSHTAGGNPARFRVGPIELRADDEWMWAQPRRDRIVATLVSLPLLRRYGYPLRVPALERRPQEDVVGS